MRGCNPGEGQHLKALNRRGAGDGGTGMAKEQKKPALEEAVGKARGRNNLIKKLAGQKWSVVQEEARVGVIACRLPTMRLLWLLVRKKPFPHLPASLSTPCSAPWN